MSDDRKIKVSVIMPCRNEGNTVGACIDEVRSFFDARNIAGEIIVVDNCSDDESASIAMDHGARLIVEDMVGYGNAVRCGLNNASGEILIIADCDMTYDFEDMDPIIDLLNDGYDMVVGNRFEGGIEKGAMPISHKVGGRFLSCLANKRFGSGIYDFHCGLRGIRREALNQLDLKTTGMEFATEMVACAKKAGLKITETPVRLKKCNADRRSKLNTIRDGMRHLIYILFGGR